MMKVRYLMSLVFFFHVNQLVAAEHSGCQMPDNAPSASQGQKAFDAYSWDMFIALNWPASKTVRGKANCDKPLSADGIRVWQTYKTSTQVFLKGAQQPTPWNKGYIATTNTLTLNQIAKASNKVAVESHMQAVGAWLIDQHKNPTYFEMLVNETWYNYVVNNGFYNRDNFNNQTQITLPEQSMELKAAWRILTSVDKAERYITQQSNVVEFNDAGEPIVENKKSDPIQYKMKSVTLGLVGLHIVYKTKASPQWIWATFEHEDNVPKAVYDAKKHAVIAQPETGVTYSYYDKHAKPDQVNQSPCAASDPNKCQSFLIPNPLTRLTPIRESAAQLNQQIVTQAPVKGSALSHYQLVTTQWPSMPDNPAVPVGQPTPTIAANVTMESYIQTTSNCMNCHFKAVLPGTVAKSDFSFLFGQANNAQTIKGVKK